MFFFPPPPPQMYPTIHYQNPWIQNYLQKDHLWPTVSH